MTRSYNVIQAARYIDCDPKTIRRWLKQGKLTAERTARGWLAIPSEQVEHAKLLWQNDREQFASPGMPRDAHPVPSVLSLGKDRQHDDSLNSIRKLEERLGILEHQLPAISVLTKALGTLQARVDVQQAHIEEMERRIADLESQDYPDHTENVPTLPVPTPMPQNIPTAKEHQNRNVALSEEGMLSASDFATQLGIKYDDIKNYMRRGVEGERLEFTEIPHATRAGYVQKYFSVEQQQKAIAVLKRHGKL